MQIREIGDLVFVNKTKRFVQTNDTLPLSYKAPPSTEQGKQSALLNLVSMQLESSCSIMNGRVIGLRVGGRGDLMLPVPLIASQDLLVYKGKDSEDYLYTDGNLVITKNLVFSIKSGILYNTADNYVGDNSIGIGKLSKQAKNLITFKGILGAWSEYVVSFSESEIKISGGNAASRYVNLGTAVKLKGEQKDLEKIGLLGALVRNMKNSEKRLAKKERRRVKKELRKILLKEAKERIGDFLDEHPGVVAFGVIFLYLGIVTGVIYGIATRIFKVPALNGVELGAFIALLSLRIISIFIKDN